MAAQEGELVGDDGLVRRPVVDVEVVDAGIGAQLAPWRPLRRRDRRPRPGNAVGLADADQPGAVEAGGVPGRPVGAPEQPARGDAVAPARVLAVGDDPAPTGLGVRSVDRSGLVRLPDRRQVLAAQSRQQDPRGHGWGGAVRLAHQVEEGDLADRGGDAGVGGRGGKRVAAAHRGTEGHDPRGVDAWEGAGPGDRRRPVLELAARVEQVRLAAAVAEATVVEDEGREPGGGEALGERAQPVAPRPRQAVRHDHDRRPGLGALRRVVPGGAGIAAAAELNLLASHAFQTAPAPET